MARVALVTQFATYQGDLDLAAPGGQPVRFLDSLNFPHRLSSGGAAAAPSLTLSDAVRRNDLTGVVSPCGPKLSLRPGAILAAYEVDAESAPRSPEARAGSVYEQRRHSQESTRVIIFLENGVRVDATVGGGLQTLDSAKPGKGDFVACREAQVHDTRRDKVKQLAFVAINVRRIEGAALAPAE